LEQQTEQLKQQTHALARQARWWRGIACGVTVFALGGWGLQAGNTADAAAADQIATMQNTIAALQDKFRHITSATNDQGNPEVVITGANLRIVNGRGVTHCFVGEPNCPNGLGNLIVGYNELRSTDPSCTFPTVCEDIRTGSHNIVVGAENNFQSDGGLVVSDISDITGVSSAVVGGFRNTASGARAVVVGALDSRASSTGAVVVGGDNNTASGAGATVSGGSNNTASGDDATVSGGDSNTASGLFNATVSGGNNNTASGSFATTVSGGQGITQAQDGGWAAGSFGGGVSGRFSSP
jgi:hypothetical protein